MFPSNHHYAGAPGSFAAGSLTGSALLVSR